MPRRCKSSGSTYEVGYGRPPKHTRFKPGESGNRKGRPKGRPNLKTVFDAALNEKVTINKRGRTRRVTVAQAIALQMTANAAKGDPRAFATIVQIAKLTGMIEEPAREEPRELSDGDRAILDDFIARNQLGDHSRTEPPSAPDDPEPAGDD